MRKGPEAKFRQKVCSELKKCNALIYPLIGSQFQREDRIYSQNPGMSDVIMIHRYTGIVFLEFKAANGKLSIIQQRFLEEVNSRCDWSGFVVREPDELEYLDKDMKIGSWMFNTGKELIDIISKLKKGEF